MTWPGATSSHVPGAGRPEGDLPGPLTTLVLTTFEEVDGWRAEWEALVQRSSTCQATASPFWLLAWWRIFGGRDGRALRLGLFLDGERLVGLAPLLLRTHRYRRLLPFRRIELLGTGEDEADEVASEYVGLIAERGREPAVAAAFASALREGRFGACDEVVLSGLDGGAPLSTLVESSFVRNRLAVEVTNIGSAPYIPLPATWEAYLASLSGSGRYLIKRSQRDFDGWAAGRSRVACVATAADLPEGMRVLARLHEERWRAAGRPGAFASEAFRAFHEAVLPELLARGALDLRWLCVEEEPVAVSYSLVWNNRVQFYQGGRTTNVPKGIRPGIVLHAHSIRVAIEAGREEYDFLAGDGQYKRQLATAERGLLTVRGVNSAGREHIRRRLERGVDVLRRARNLWRGAENPGG
jgi:CelD/BcsL family acetyltransferase involved in cellulose biosynthesis